MVTWLLPKVGGGFATIWCMSYFAPDLKFKLLLPQSYLMKEKHGGEFKMNNDG